MNSMDNILNLISQASDMIEILLPIYLIYKVIAAIIYLILPFKIFNIRENAEVTATNTEAIYRKLETITIKLDEIQEAQENKKTIDNKN